MPEQKNDLKGWCKIITTEERDYLVQKFYDNEKEKDCVMISTTSLCAFLKATIGFDTPEKADKAFDDITIENIGEYGKAYFGAFILPEQETLFEEE